MANELVVWMIADIVGTPLAGTSETFREGELLSEVWVAFARRQNARYLAPEGRAHNGPPRPERPFAISRYPVPSCDWRWNNRNFENALTPSRTTTSFWRWTNRNKQIFWRILIHIIKLQIGAGLIDITGSSVAT